MDIGSVIDSFLQTVDRTVNKTFCDVQLNKRFFRVDSKLRGDRVQVRFDPFAALDTVKLYSLDDQYLGAGILHDRSSVMPVEPCPKQGKIKHNYIELLIREHQKNLAEQTGGIDYRKVVDNRSWPFFEFAKTVGKLLGKKAGLADLSAGELEALKKVYNQSTSINRRMVKEAFEKARHPSVFYIIAELKQLIGKEKNHVS